MTELTLTSWNIHRACGNDGRVDPVRSVDVLLAEVCADMPDILVLTEADEEARPHRGLLDLERIAAKGLVHAHTDPAQRWGAESHGFHGVVFFTQGTVAVQDITLLDLPGHCHRGAVIVDATSGGTSFRVIGTHLSLGQPLRIVQMRTIGQHLARRAPRPTILAGDLNEWRPWGGLALAQGVTGMNLKGAAPATFPIRRPIVPLDRILVAGGASLRDARVLDGPGIRATSDHRPITGRIAVPAD